jgi:hypothetical protein
VLLCVLDVPLENEPPPCAEVELREPPTFAPPALPPAERMRLRAAMTMSIPVPRFSGSPVMAGFSPIFAMMLSILRATRAMPTTSTLHGKTMTPVGMTDKAEMMSFRNTTLRTIIRSMLAYMRIYPVNISFVALDPPMAKPSGESRVRIATTT